MENRSMERGSRCRRAPAHLPRWRLWRTEWESRSCPAVWRMSIRKSNECGPMNADDADGVTRHASGLAARRENPGRLECDRRRVRAQRDGVAIQPVAQTLAMSGVTGEAPEVSKRRASTTLRRAPPL